LDFHREHHDFTDLWPVIRGIQSWPRGKNAWLTGRFHARIRNYSVSWCW